MDLSPDEEHFQGRLLHQAALWDNLELLQELLASGAEADARDEHRRSALHAAALAERSQCLAALCAAGADVDAVSDENTGGKTALHVAAERGHVENIRALLRARADPGRRDAAGATPRDLAERAGRRHAARALRDAEDALERERLAQHAELRELVARGDAAQLKARLAALGGAAGLLVNLTPGGAHTLLYLASEAGQGAVAALLLAVGADGRAQAATRYGPLYAAAGQGRAPVAALLLQHFPQAAQQETVEKWLPLHAAVIGGHAALVTLLLEYPYPESLLTTYTDARGEWQYRAAFDINARDVSGQTALHMACTLGNLPCVNALLDYTTACEPTDDSQCVEPPSIRPAAPTPSPLRSGISLGIHAIVNKLTGGGANRADRASAVRKLRPARADAVCAGDACVSRAARAGHADVLQALLRAGAAPDAPAAPPDPPPQPAPASSEPAREARRRSRSVPAPPAAGGAARASASPSPARAPHSDNAGPWTALGVACRAQHAACAELLLAHGAADPAGRALAECVRHGLADLAAKILATKAYPDPEYKLNKSSLSERVLGCRARDAALSYSAVCPSAPVLVNWRELRAHVSCLRMSWLRLASLHVNNKLSSASAALLAITRIDVSNNELRLLPPELFAMPSLRYLNAAQNKLSRLPSPEDPLEEEGEGGGWRGRGKRGKRLASAVFTAPALQELYLQDNRLEELPPGLFSLEALGTLDVSNNKLRALPDALWAAPALRDLNAAFNHLKDLPTGEGENTSGSSSPLASSPVEQRSASAAAQFPNTSLSESSSRSPSIDATESESDDGEPVPTLADRAGHAVCTEARRAHAWRGAVEPPAPAPRGRAPLHALNLAHNQFTCVPRALACRAAGLARLNLSYNSLRSMSYVTSYPSSLRQLDLSHNEITCWPSLPQLENFGSGSPLECFCPHRSASRPRSGGGVRSQLMSAACPARRHLRLEGTRTLILSNNLLTRIQLTTDDDGSASDALPPDTPGADDDDWGAGSSLRARLLFPLLSMLDVSCNLLRAVPPALHLLAHLSVLNISGNKDITSLPPQMGLLSRLWSLNAGGCSLQEPLRSMVTGGKYKSADVVGYLKSVLHSATKYSRMRLMLVGQQGIGKTSLLECLRQESAIQHRRKPTDHWATRMGNKSSRRNMSTVGVDIGSWVYEKQRSTRGPVTFRTWDFGGQQEYYATHQYFLSRRSLYLVVWKVTDGRKGLLSALTWLRSIQARAPGSPVIMVGTHYDQVCASALPDAESPEALQRLVRSAVMGAPDADKLGLPRVMDSLEVSCSTRHNIRLLADIIYSVAYSVKPPGSKEPLLEQRIPASYLALEECVTSLAADLTEPVLNHTDYKRLVTQYMQQKNLKMFRDAAELHQATMFLHENGVLLHYDDATLKELYFLRPQWLCDVLAHVVTVREINPFATNGIMKVEDLAHVFKASPQLARAEEASSLGVSLLHKFELALCWDARTLLIPPLLPATEPLAPQLPVRGRVWSSASRGNVRRPWPALNPHPPLQPDSNRRTDSPALIQEGATSPGDGISVSGRSGTPLTRLLLVTYVPCGFWARLCSRLLADTALARTPHQLYRAAEMESDDSVSRALELEWGWKVWQYGARLVCGDLTLVCVREIPPSHEPLLPLPQEGGSPHPYENIKLRVKQEGAWCELDVQSSACIEIQLPAQSCVVRRHDNQPIAGYQSISLEPNPSTLAKVLAIVSEHVDLLLEDWYPSLGTRFVHTSEGRCLITRVVPCPGCLRDLTARPRDPDHLAQQAFRRLELVAEPRPRVSQDSRTSDGDSGVGAESNASSRIGSVEGIAEEGPPLGAYWAWAWAWTVEQCIHCACASLPLHCPLHPDVALHHVAPDTLLLDVPEEMRARWEHITRRAVAGRGAFGTVLRASWRSPRGDEDVALKALQPVPPPPGSDPHALQAYKAALARWERSPLPAACRAYCGLRQELTILSALRHAHAVPLRAVCAAPLALLLELAPLGGLDGVIRSYSGAGARLGARAARAALLQVARALEHLHDRRIVYRDLKSENVLVWRMPRVQDALAAELDPTPIDVHVKLGDYGISRLAPPSGTKGFGGTEGFMAPEIMRYNGEEEYNEKVDCFSFGMLMYEVISGRQPFEGHEAVKEAILEGVRPSLSPREIEYPICMLEVMRRCWAGAPGLRPAAGALVSALAAPEAVALRDAAAARAGACHAALRIHLPESGGTGWEVWYGGGEPERAHALLVPSAHFTHHHTLRVPPDNDEPVMVTAMCRVGGAVWIGDSAGRLSVFSAASCALQWAVRVREAVGGARSPIAALQPLRPLERVALALSCGRLFLVSSRRPQEEGSFVLTELGTATELCCLAARAHLDQVQVWAGGAGLCEYVVRAGGVSAAVQRGAARVALLAAEERTPAVFAHTQPGACIYMWSEGQQTARLDCSKLAPCSESLQNMDDGLDEEKCKVTALCCAAGLVFAGTARGCVVVAAAASLRPLSVCRPYEADVTGIVPLVGGGEGGDDMVASFGSGYRPLLQRYAPLQASNSHSGYYCLLWKAHHWLPD